MTSAGTPAGVTSAPVQKPEAPLVRIPPRRPLTAREVAVRSIRATCGAGVCIAAGWWWITRTDDAAALPRTMVTDTVAVAALPAPIAVPEEPVLSPASLRLKAVLTSNVSSGETRRAHLADAVASCKDQAAACDMNDVVRVGRELVELRRRGGRAR